MLNQIIQGDCREVLKTLPDNSVNCCVTSPPYYGLRDYGADGQIGLEETPAEYVKTMVEVFREVKRVLTQDGSIWVNLGDSYASTIKGSGGMNSNKLAIKGKQNYQAFEPRRINHGLKPKDLIGIPWRVAFALQEDGWYLRSDIIWHKPNPMPESVTDRPTKSHEYIFLLTKSERYFYDATSIAEPLLRPEEAERKTPAVFGGKDKFTEAKKQSRLHSGNEYLGTPTGKRNKRTVWTVATQPYTGSHFATFPEKLIEPCILAGCPAGGTVLDPFGGSGTTGRVATKLGRNSILIELNPNYLSLIEERTDKVQIKMAM